MVERFRLKGLLALFATLACAPLAVHAQQPNMDYYHEVSLEAQSGSLGVFGLTHSNIKETSFSGGLLLMHDTKENHTAPGAGFRYNYRWSESVPFYTTFGFATFVTNDDYVNTPNGQVRLGFDYIYSFNRRSGLKLGLGVTKNFAGGEDAKDYGAFFNISWMSNNRHHLPPTRE